MRLLFSEEAKEVAEGELSTRRERSLKCVRRILGE